MKEKLERLQKKCSSNGQHTAAAKSSALVLHEKLEVVTANVRDSNSESVMPLKKLDTFSKTHKRTKIKLAKNLGKTREDLVKKRKESAALTTKVVKLEKRFATARSV